jgi:glucose uptake protein GlcU
MLPKWKYDQIIPGIICGMLYSCGNFTSILAVVYLGQGMGYSIVQMSLFISGLWGIFYFNEIQQSILIIKWFMSATIAFIGIIGVSYEHQGNNTSAH